MEYNSKQFLLKHERKFWQKREDVREKNDANWGFPSIHDSFVENGLDFVKNINFFKKSKTLFKKVNDLWNEGMYVPHSFLYTK